MVDLNIKEVDEDAVLKEVFNTDEIEAKTELNEAQIEHVNKVMTLSDITGNQLLKQHAVNFMILQKSKDRKSMLEFVSVVKAKRDDMMAKGKGFFGNMFGGG